MALYDEELNTVDSDKTDGIDEGFLETYVGGVESIKVDAGVEGVAVSGVDPCIDVGNGVTLYSEILVVVEVGCSEVDGTNEGYEVGGIHKGITTSVGGVEAVGAAGTNIGTAVGKSVERPKVDGIIIMGMGGVALSGGVLEVVGRNKADGFDVGLLVRVVGPSQAGANADAAAGAADGTSDEDGVCVRSS